MDNNFNVTFTKCELEEHNKAVSNLALDEFSDFYIDMIDTECKSCNKDGAYCCFICQLQKFKKLKGLE